MLYGKWKHDEGLKWKKCIFLFSSLGSMFIIPLSCFLVLRVCVCDQRRDSSEYRGSISVELDKITFLPS